MLFPSLEIIVILGFNSFKNSAVTLEFTVLKIISGLVKESLKILKYKKGSSDYEIGTGKSMSIKKFAKRMVYLCQKSQSVLKFGSLSLRRNEPMDIKINISKLKKLGWKVNFSTDDALKETINFYL